MNWGVATEREVYQLSPATPGPAAGLPSTEESTLPHSQVYTVYVCVCLVCIDYHNISKRDGTDAHIMLIHFQSFQTHVISLFM